jgi:hypothetical protein
MTEDAHEKSHPTGATIVYLLGALTLATIACLLIGLIAVAVNVAS